MWWREASAWLGKWAANTCQAIVMGVAYMVSGLLVVAVVAWLTAVAMLMIKCVLGPFGL